MPVNEDEFNMKQTHLGHLDELPREQRLAGLGADGRGQEDLKEQGVRNFYSK